MTAYVLLPLAPPQPTDMEIFADSISPTSFRVFLNVAIFTDYLTNYQFRVSFSVVLQGKGTVHNSNQVCKPSTCVGLWLHFPLQHTIPVYSTIAKNFANLAMRLVKVWTMHLLSLIRSSLGQIPLYWRPYLLVRCFIVHSWFRALGT